MSNPNEIECPDCDGEGVLMRVHGASGRLCPACAGTGWREMTDDENDAEAERRIFNARRPWVGEPVLDLPARLDRIAAGRRALMAGAVA